MAESAVIREDYLNKLKRLKDLDVIKVVTGVRRSGKSTLLKQFRDWLYEQGVSGKQIVEINLEDLQFEELEDYHLLNQYVVERLIPGNTTYLFIDEIQNTEHFEKAINSLYLNKDIDIYITGSNSRILSGELSTRLSGRYVEIPILPPSLHEFSLLLAPELGTVPYGRRISLPGLHPAKTGTPGLSGGHLQYRTGQGYCGTQKNLQFRSV